ncbi:MAG: ATP-binding protein [Candidatus Colwellbacteria bacterium]|nr:ATP-binding protein [Candidatus Colwellbacteria bacterium]
MVRNKLAKKEHVLVRPEMWAVWLSWSIGLVIAALALLFSKSVIVGALIALLAVISSIPLTTRMLGQSKKHFNETADAARLESIVMNLASAVVAYDNNFRILVFNGAAEKMFNISKDTVLGTIMGPGKASDPSFTLLVQTLFPSLAPTVVSQSAPDALPQVADISFTNPEREFRVSTDRLATQSGVLLGFVKVIRDRTREVQLVKSKSEFVSIAAHQLRTPLTAVNWTLESLFKNQQLNEEGEVLVQSGLLATKGLLKTVNDLLGVAEIEEGRFGYKYEEVELIKFISDILDNAQLVAKKYGLEMYFDKGGFSGLKLQADPVRLGLAISNLIDNAMKYNSKSGSVTVGLKSVRDKPYIQVSIRDTGIGIAPADMEKLFQKFFRASAARRVQADGSGLGLYITKNIIQQHGGSIWAESTLGRGTTFFFTLPTDPNLIPQAERFQI